MAKYDVTFSCGHTEEKQIYGKAEERKRKIKYFQKSCVCSECYKKQMEEENAKDCEEVEMSYREYKENYSECKTKRDSYNKEEKTIVVYVPKKKEEAKDSREIMREALTAAVEEMKKTDENAKAENATPKMIAEQLEKMGYTEEMLKELKDVPETVLRDIIEKKKEWTN